MRLHYMTYLLKTKNGCTYIAIENQLTGDFTIKATGLDNNKHSYRPGNIISAQTIHQEIDNTSIHQAELVSEFENKVLVQVYKTTSNSYQVVSNGVIRHANTTPDATIRAISMYSNT